MAEVLPLSADYVVVGAGSAGCAVAARLSEDPSVTVVLLEAGGRDRNPWLHVPIGYAKTMYHPTLSWNLMTEPEPNLGGRRVPWPRGRTLGGSSAINGLLYVRGQHADYDHWRQLGCTGWGFEDVLPYFKRSEDQERGASALHGKGGPLAVSDLRDRNPLAESFIEAAVELGLPRNDDFNGAEQEGAGFYQTTSRNGWRCSAATAYLKPARGRPNLTVVTDAHSTGLLLEGRRAAGVKLERHGAKLTIKAVREVILCGGAIASPHLLMLSGIGPAAHLQEMGIAVVHDLPSVGRNLQDHFQARLAYRVNQKASMNTRTRTWWGKALMGAEFALRRTGPLTVSAGTAGLFARVLPGSATPDVQFHFLPFSTSATMLELHPFPGMTLSVCQLRPESRGTITLASPDPRAKALIHANYLATETDRRCMIEGAKLGRRLAQTAALSRWVEEEIAPGPGAVSDEDWLEWIRRTGGTIYHPSGTCRMGGDPASVVDPELRVRGIEGLRVADASIMPTVVSGNTNAPAIMIGEKCADMVKAAAKQRLAA
ncbi:choline dehydrogenase [Siccirubricoccus sp. KC 17139]|uniref:Choline dehydrogenase n=1 Tax=Siccirubricoccus soli TaxID=2899147 RepID=A0ABT1D2Z3_9PROT|nr:choline dehydrogenase [Siccirubricoccus soli]MCO6415645.1 choline dehydrogenase [Siccirubricoccus soli]MCP2681777.1 choline dehydrogenase [Siccirubricoccus soli]